MTPTPSDPAAPDAGTPIFDITKQVWTFDPEDFSINVDGMWDLCYLGDPDDFPCVDDEDRPRLYAEVVACGKAIAALPQLIGALQEIAKGEGAYSRNPLTHAANTIESMKALAVAALAAAAPTPSDAGRDHGEAGK